MSNFRLDHNRCFERDFDQSQPIVVPDELPENDIKRLDFYLCISCNNRITKPADAIIINACHRHTLRNPTGVLFHIGCFAAIIGYGEIGEPSAEHTWFAGYSWRIGLCANCHLHLGWGFYAASGNHFYGLIMNRLILQSDHDC